MTITDSDAEPADAITTVDLEGDIDLATAGPIGDRLGALVESGLDAIVVRCEAVTFVESRGLAMMARVQRLAEDAGCTLTWRALPLSVLRTIHLSGLDTYLRIEA
jgi:anti-anti-sigma factor